MKPDNEMFREPLISTQKLCKELGFLVTIAFLERIGASPVARSSQGTYWKKSDIPAIRKAIAKHLLEAS